MRNFTRWMLTGSLAALCTVALSTAAVAQQQQQQQQQRERQAQAQQQGGQLTEQDLVHWVLLDNLAEIQIAQFAQEKAQSQQVKQYAQKMIQDHQQAVQKLRQLAPDIQLPQLAARAQEGQEGRAFRPQQQQQRQQQQQQQRQQQGRGVSSAPLPVSSQQLREALAQKYLSTTVEQLQQQEGEMFDKTFIAGQAVMHALSTDNAQVFQQIAQSSELKQALQQLEQTTTQHQREAKQIFEQLTRGGQQGQQQQRRQQQQNN